MITYIPFSSLPWASGAHPLEKKKTWPDCGASLLQFEAGFEDPNWCERGHVLYVLEGALEVELDASQMIVDSGGCAVIDPGTRHRAKNRGPAPVVVFVVTR